MGSTNVTIQPHGLFYDNADYNIGVAPGNTRNFTWYISEVLPLIPK
jgi:hypothetical protein